MKKFIDSADELVHDCAVGLVLAHQKLVALSERPLFVFRRTAKKGRVALISGSGSGHEPADIGYVGRGMLDAACPGALFTAPTPAQIVAAAKQVHAGRGVLTIVRNHPGDNACFDTARDMLDMECASVLVYDDVAVENSQHANGRRGIAGSLIVQKMVGAAAEADAGLYECKAIGDRASANTASMGVALTSCTPPDAGRNSFDIGENDMEFGVGLRGEPGLRREEIKPASLIVDDLLSQILATLKPARGGDLLLHVNGFGGTPTSELYLLNKLATERLQAEGLRVTDWLVGNHTTSLDAAGASLSVTVLDDELKWLWAQPVATPSLHW